MHLRGDEGIYATESSGCVYNFEGVVIVVVNNAAS